MLYFTKMHTEDEVRECTKEEARYFLEGAYIKETVDAIIDNEKKFRLSTPYRDVWTQTEDGLIPVPGFYGVDVWT